MAVKAQQQKNDSYNFGERLRELMNCRGIKSAHKLATNLYDKGYVKIDQQEYLSGENEIKRKHAIDSVRKKIQSHLKAKDASRVWGEYIEAYCRLFDCSSDYLIGRTDIRTPDIEARMICEKTGLSESAVTRLMSDEPAIYISKDFWSILIESQNNLDICHLWINLCSRSKDCISSKAEIKSIEEVAKKKKNKAFADYEYDPMKTSIIRQRNRLDEVDSIEFRLSRQVTEALEAEILRRLDKEKWFEREKARILPMIENYYENKNQMMEAIENDSYLQSEETGFKFNDHSDELL